MQTLAVIARQRPFLERARRRYGNVFSMRLLGFGLFVVVADTKLIKQVFTEKPTVLHAGGDQNPLGPILGEHSLLVIDEDRHLAQRKLLLPPFHGQRMAAYEDLIAGIAAEEIDRWPRGVLHRTERSFRDITLRAILRAVFGAQGDEVATLERILPPEPDRFHPQRFAHSKPDTYAWIPFGGGVRRCIGAAFAHMEMDVVLRTLLEHRRIVPDPAAADAGWRFRGVGHTPADGGAAVFA